jgi:hypothetical protein
MADRGVAGDMVPPQTALLRACNDVASKSEDPIDLLQVKHVADNPDHVFDDGSTQVDYNDAVDAVALVCPTLKICLEDALKKTGKKKNDNPETKKKNPKTKPKKVEVGPKRADKGPKKNGNPGPRKIDLGTEKRTSDTKAGLKAGFSFENAAVEFDANVFRKKTTTDQTGEVSYANRVKEIVSRLEEYSSLLATFHIRRDIKMGVRDITEEARKLELDLRADVRLQAPVDKPKESSFCSVPGRPMEVETEGAGSVGTSTSPKHATKRRRVMSSSSSDAEVNASKGTGKPCHVDLATGMEVDVGEVQKKKKKTDKEKPVGEEGAQQKKVSTPATSGSQWSKVVARKRKPKGAKPNPEAKARAEKRPQKSVRILKAPRTEAIVISTVKEGMTHAEVLRLAKGSVDPVAMSARIVATRRTKAGDLLLEVKGKESADTLARKIGEAVKDHAKVRRPQAMREVMLLGVDPSATVEETRVALQTGTGSTVDGSAAIVLRPARNGTQFARVTLPTKDVITLSKKGFIQVGWTRARVKVLDPRPLRCFRCLGHGHVAKVCNGPDRTKLCYRCGTEGHPAKDCKNPPRCVACAEAGKPAKHTIGSGDCGLKKDRNTKK